MIGTPDAVYQNFDNALIELQESLPFTRSQKSQKLASQIDILARTSAGLKHIYKNALALEAAGFFKETPWGQPQQQNPALVKGTLLSGHPNSSFEIASELRILAYAEEEGVHEALSPQEAGNFIEEVLVHNLEFAFDELTEASRLKLTQQERKKIVSYFKFLMQNLNLNGVKAKLAQEIQELMAQKPIVSDGIRNLIQTAYQKIELEPGQATDDQLQRYINSLYYPAPLADANPRFNHYREALTAASDAQMEEEVQKMGANLEETGLGNPYLAILLRHLVQNKPDAVPQLLGLSPEGESEWNRYREFASELTLEVFTADNFQGIYGFKRLLERNLFSRRAVRAGITNLRLVTLHPKVAQRIVKSVSVHSSEASAKPYLLAALISILGQPLGIGQGNNATCQSARGISLWAQHAPAKLINLLTTVATANNLILRFENYELESLKLQKGLVDQLDYKLDAVSVVLVPHLDKIYNEMMRLAAGRGEDPHKWVNPALYGQWIQTSFASAYSYMANSIHDFTGFIRIFYASFHPQFNGGRTLVYPNPVGIFITSAKAEMLGFHAVSLLRISKKDGHYRAYFLNPNNEGRQDWGQGISPTVFGNGERAGESSLPIEYFAARLYAFHYNAINVQPYLDKVPEQALEPVIELAQNSWGKKYTWNNTPKVW
jgi:hypothetical protein